MRIVTAISDSESEEIVTSLLFSQGFEIAFRAISLYSLYNFISNQKDSFVVIYDYSFESKLDFRKSFKFDSQHRYIRFEPKTFNPAVILSEISSFKHNYLATSIERLPNVTSVMGTPGAPGVSTLANFLGLILECTLVCSSHQNLRPLGNAIVKNISPENIIPSLKDNLNNQILIDAGSSVNLTSTLSDRRVGARWLREVVGSSSQLIYVVKSNTQGINYLTEFMKDFSNLINPPSITVILNQQRFDRSSQEIQSSFKKLMGGYSNFVLPFNSRIEVDSSSKQVRSSIWGMNSFQKQLAKIAAQVGKKKLYH